MGLDRSERVLDSLCLWRLEELRALDDRFARIDRLVVLRLLSVAAERRHRSSISLHANLCISLGGHTNDGFCQDAEVGVVAKDLQLVGQARTCTFDVNDKTKVRNARAQ